jgi:transcriptional regulator with XRE-family HTH domain
MQPTDPNAVAVARHVRQVLSEAGVSAAEVARRLGWTQAYLARRMTHGVPFSAADLMAIAGVLNIPATRLVPERAA